MSTEKRSIPWARWSVEFILILVSVYLAVFLESSKQARSDHEAARAALEQLLGELREDQADIARIIAAQDGLNQDYLNVERWLEDPAKIPQDSIGGALRRIVDNPTLFARRSSWSTMIAAGQLPDLDAPELVLRLGQLYETVYTRIDYNSRYYDTVLNEALAATMAIRWGALETRPLTSDAAKLQKLSLKIQGVHVMWNVWYRELLRSYVDQVGETIEAVETYLSEGP